MVHYLNIFGYQWCYSRRCSQSCYFSSVYIYGLLVKLSRLMLMLVAVLVKLLLVG